MAGKPNPNLPSPTDALRMYLELGPSRTLTEVQRRLGAADRPVSYNALNRWAKKEGWSFKAAEYDAAIQDKTANLLGEVGVEQAKQDADQLRQAARRMMARCADLTDALDAKKATGRQILDVVNASLEAFKLADQLTGQCAARSTLPATQAPGAAPGQPSPVMNKIDVILNGLQASQPGPIEGQAEPAKPKPVASVLRMPPAPTNNQ